MARQVRSQRSLQTAAPPCAPYDNPAPQTAASHAPHTTIAPCAPYNDPAPQTAAPNLCQHDSDDETFISSPSWLHNCARNAPYDTTIPIHRQLRPLRPHTTVPLHRQPLTACPLRPLRRSRCTGSCATLRRVRTLQDSSGRFRTPQDASGRFRSPQDASGRLTMPHYASRLHKHQNSPNSARNRRGTFSLGPIVFQ